MRITSFGTSSGTAAGNRLGLGTLGNVARAADPAFGQVALGRERVALEDAQRQAAASQQALQAASGSPFAAARTVGRALGQQTSQIRQATDDQLAAEAEAERQRQEAERLRREQQAQQWLAAGLSTAGSVLGSVVVPGLGGALGGAASQGLGSALGGGRAAPPTSPAQPTAPTMPVYDPRLDHAGGGVAQYRWGR